MQVPDGISIKELFTEFSPKVAKEQIEASGAVAELAGTEFSLVVDVDGDVYSYVVKDGKDFDVKNESLDKAMVRLSISKADIEKMIATKNLDMLLGIQNDLNRNKYNVLSNLKGAMKTELKNDDGSSFVINVIFNDTTAPACTFKMTMADSTAIINKETHPVNLFMTGAMQIEGDMGFAISTQPLFT